jgi:hypothetical protein
MTKQRVQFLDRGGTGDASVFFLLETLMNGVVAIGSRIQNVYK